MIKPRGWKTGIISETLTSFGGGSTILKGSEVYYKRYKTIPDEDGYKLTEYEWHYTNTDKRNLIRTTKLLIDGITPYKETNIINEIEPSDTKIIEVYRIGWVSEPDIYVGKTSPNIYLNKTLQTAYNIGRDHYIMGDDISSFDCKTNEEILLEIKTIVNRK